jgi:hypothetical protein
MAEIIFTLLGLLAVFGTFIYLARRVGSSDVDD